MNLFCLTYKKQPRHGQASNLPTTSDVPTTTSALPSKNPASNTSHPVDFEVLVQGLAPITAE